MPESQSVGWIVYFDVRVTRSNEKGHNGKKRSEQCAKLLFKERIRMANNPSRQVMGVLADRKWSLGRKVAVTSTPGLFLDLPSPTPNFGVFLKQIRDVSLKIRNTKYTNIYHVLNPKINV